MKITKLTSEHEARIDEWVKKWMAIGLSTEPADFDKATAAALAAYRLCGLTPPKVVLHVGSPYAATLGGTFAWLLLRELGARSSAESPVRSKVKSRVKSQVRSQVGSEVWSKVWSQVDSQVGSKVDSQVRSQVWSQVWSKLGLPVWSQVDSQVASQVGLQVWSEVWSKVQSQVGSQVASQVRLKVASQVWSKVWSQVDFEAGKAVNNNRGGAFWASWCAYISFFRDVMDWNDPVLERFQIDEDLTTSCGWVWWHEDALAISDRPKRIALDERGLLHSQTGKAIEYRDGWGFAAWHGTVIPEEWLTGSVLTPQLALTTENIEQRRAACEILGWDKILAALNARVIDRHESEYIGTLLEADLPDSGPERFLRVKCGTGRQFVIPVPRTMNTAHAANAWTYGLNPNQLNPEFRT